MSEILYSLTSQQTGPWGTTCGRRPILITLVDVQEGTVHLQYRDPHQPYGKCHSRPIRTICGFPVVSSPTSSSVKRHCYTFPICNAFYTSHKATLHCNPIRALQCHMFNSMQCKHLQVNLLIHFNQSRALHCPIPCPTFYRRLQWHGSNPFPH